MPMKNPPHPGRSIKDARLEPLNLSVTDGAKVLGVARHTLSRVINGQAGFSPDMAICLEKRLVERQKVGYACRPVMTSPRPGNMKTGLM